jgi:hypothetical protein
MQSYKFMLFLLFISSGNCFAMESVSLNLLESGSVRIKFYDGAERILNKKYINNSPVLRDMLLDTLSSSSQPEEIIMPQIINPQMWDLVGKPVLIKGEREARGLMNVFHNRSEHKAIMESANIFDFLGLDELLNYKVFHLICFLYEMRTSPYAKTLEILNPGLAELIYATQP